MPAELVQRIDLDLIYPPFLERVLDGLAACRARGFDYFATRGFASWAKQHQLYMAFLNGTGGRAAPAGSSSHNYGLALDFTFDADRKKPGLQPSWKEREYDVLGEEMQKLGLHWGANYNDRPHVSWPTHVNGKQLRGLGSIAMQHGGTDTTEGRLAVWRHLDENPPLNLPPLVK